MFSVFSQRASCVLFALSAITQFGCAQSDLAPRPPMGWNSWNHFYQHVTDADVRAAADAMVANGMRDAGYVYVNIDDGWQGTRRPDGTIESNNRFPDMKALADYVHARGLKLGIYSSPGPRTCAKFEGSYGHEAQDAKTYASWGIDYLKYDLCSFGDVLTKAGNGDQSSPAAFAAQRDAYRKMHYALVATGRPIVFSLCQYGMSNVWEWGPKVGGNLWRTTGDISDKYDRMALIGFSQAGLSRFAGPGHWNDPDMLEVGNGGMSLDEYRTHMSLWAILAAPLLAGNDLSQMKPEHLAILENKDVIAIDQDALGKQGDRFSAVGPYEIWTKPLTRNRMAVALFNRAELAHTVEVNLRQLGVPTGATIRDVWTGREMQDSETLNPIVPKHGVVLLLISR
ncbi:alpha-galactosidase [Bryocella elongata]|uniref:Alpha-galactosidase n=1 Tax=Bryocella elongata TaxID=863522 RepID=A0A1H5ZLF2_9BACT|nr:glycoside hydrolase family 27 protein [Bryocella elongata]SEG36477.1 alpha-galactosidase [Bryocella elongata]